MSDGFRTGSGDLRISVVIPTYKGFDRLIGTIRSALDQEFPAHEVIVVDDGSPDQTPEVEGMFGARIRYIRVENGGQQRARNIAVAAATGDWVALLDHDDLWEPGYLAEVNTLVRASGVAVTMCNSRTRLDRPEGSSWLDTDRFRQFAPLGYWERVAGGAGERWSVLERYDYGSYLLFHPSQTSMLTICRALWDRLGGFDERMRGSGAENFEFEIRALRVAQVGLIWAPLVVMVRHDSNASLDASQMAMDVADCLNFALANHGLDAAERGAVETLLPRRLLAAIDGAFLLGEFGAVRRYAWQFGAGLPFKARVKAVVAALPGPAARPVSAMLTGGFRTWLPRPAAR